MLGLLPPTNFLGGRMTLDVQLAEYAMQHLSARIALPPLRTAHGMFRVANAVMADAIRLRTVFAGLDPREFTLVSFGGAGGLHCAAVAAELGIRTVVIPRMASVFSALGLVSTDVTYSFAWSDQRELGPGGTCSDAELKEMNATFEELEKRVAVALEPHAISPDRVSTTYRLELSYRRQILNFEVEAPSRLTHKSLAALVGVFDNRYRAVYGPGAAAPEHGYSLKTFRVTGIGGLARPSIPGSAPSGDAPVPVGKRAALADVDRPELIELAIYDGEALRSGQSFSGPAVVEYSDTTVLVPVRVGASVDAYGNLVLEREEG
jgi:N-methylhydantoinase A